MLHKNASISGGFMKIVSITLYGAACFVAAPLAAQTLPASAPVTTSSPSSTPVAPPAAVSMAPIAGQQSVLRAGTEVPLTVSEELTTKGKALKSGQRFMMSTAAPVEINGQIVIPAGSPVTGEVTEVRNKGMWGKSGRIAARVLFVRAYGRQIRMTGTVDDRGVTGTVGVVAAVAFVPVVGFFTTGTSATIPVGAPVKAFIDEDVTFTVAAAVPDVMVVPAASTPPSK